MILQRRCDALEPLLLLLRERVLRKGDDGALSGRRATSRGPVLARPLPGGRRRDLLRGRILRDARLHAIDREPMGRKGRVNGDSRERLGDAFVVPVLASSDGGKLNGSWADDAKQFGFEGYDQGIIMAEGERNLFTILAQEVLGFDAIRTMLHEVLLCIKHLHNRGVVHADIKPLNVSVQSLPLQVMMCLCFADHAHGGRQI